MEYPIKPPKAVALSSSVRYMEKGVGFWFLYEVELDLPRRCEQGVDMKALWG